MKIQTFAQLAEISTQAIRYYESVGLLSPQRQANGYRDYSAADLHNLHLIRALKALGLSLREIKAIFAIKQLPSGQICQQQTELLVDKMLQKIAAQQAFLHQANQTLLKVKQDVITKNGQISTDNLIQFLSTLSEPA